jgi:hypothetical protein
MAIPNELWVDNELPLLVSSPTTEVDDDPRLDVEDVVIGWDA